METYYKILVADDSDAIHMNISHMVVQEENIKYTLFNATNGREACEIANIEHPDIILMDIQMPEMSGIEATKHIKQQQALSEIPIIIMSSTRSFAEAFTAGADDFILKPFNQYELMLRINLNIKYALKSIETKRKTELLELQRKEVIFQRDKIVSQQKEIYQDMQYASYMQAAIMPTKSVLDILFKNYFIYNKPKSIVSGDFYWATKKNEWQIICVGDCTGHGISGALMTMAGIAFLNEIVNNNCVYEPDKILNELRERVINLLNQKGNIGEASNGMDIAVCAINVQKKKILYSGANNPIYLVKKDETLEIIKADRMPIGIHYNTQRPFTLKEFVYNGGDSIYLFTDGYADQFGGSSGQKFRYNQFQELVVYISSYPIEKQSDMFDNTMNEWKGAIEQVDDILILGIQL